LPKNDIIQFLNHISTSEKLNMTEHSLSCIQKLYKSDIRSMINFMQSNKNISNEQAKLFIIDDNVWEEIITLINKREKIDKIKGYIEIISIQYNVDKKNIIKDFLNYIIRNYLDCVDTKFLNFIENFMHSQIQNNDIYIYYSLSKLLSFSFK
jgi:replication factor C subunit 3/5